MLNYYLALGLRSLRRNPALTLLMVLTLALGVAASVATTTILHVMSADPIPHKSDRLFVPMVDNGPTEGYKPGEDPGDVQMSYIDAVNFMASGQGERRTMLYGVYVTLEPQRKELGAIGSDGLAVTSDFFPMFEVPLLHGQAWSAAEDKAGANVVVLSRALSEKIFGTDNSVGQELPIAGQRFKVIGVLQTWRPVPRYYHAIAGNGVFGEEDQFFIPVSSAVNRELGNHGSTSCSGPSEPGFQGRLRSECTWMQFWFETKSAADRAGLQSYLDSYSREQLKLGRLKRQAKNHLYDVGQWMERLEVVEKDNRLAAWLAAGFLLLCLVNTVGLLLAKMSSRAGEVGVRRALGASRGDVFKQFFVEAVVVGLAGGVLGLALAYGALKLIALQSSELAIVAHMDWQMLALTFVLSVLAAVAAGLLPTWRACNVTPALQLKTQ